MKRTIVMALAICSALIGVNMPGVRAQDDCGAAEGVDLAVQSARLRQREDGWVVLYTVTNRGRMPSTSYTVSLLLDGATVGNPDQYTIGLDPGHRRRWELEVPADSSPTSAHELAVRVATAGPGSPAGPSYTDQCEADDILPASQATPARSAWTEAVFNGG